MQDTIDKFKTCKDCPDRSIMPNCHSTCEGYIARCERQQAINNERRRRIEEDVRYYHHKKRR